MTDRIMAANGAGSRIILTALGNHHYHEGTRSIRGQRSIADFSPEYRHNGSTATERISFRARWRKRVSGDRTLFGMNTGNHCSECEACK